jgi:hypothetical protein
MPVTILTVVHRLISGRHMPPTYETMHQGQNIFHLFVFGAIFPGTVGF